MAPHLDCCTLTTTIFSCGHTPSPPTLITRCNNTLCHSHPQRILIIHPQCPFCLARTASHPIRLLSASGGAAFVAHRANVQAALLARWERGEMGEEVAELEGEMQRLDMQATEGRVGGERRFACGHVDVGAEWQRGVDVRVRVCEGCERRARRNGRLMGG